MTNSFVLIGHTTGDGLIPSQQIPIATSTHRENLESLQTERERERSEWLATHEVSDDQASAVYFKETIVEVRTI